MPGLWAAVIAFALVGAGAAIAAIALAAAVALVRRPVGRRRALGALAFGAIQAATGAAIIWLVDHGPFRPATVDLAAPALAAAAIAVGVLFAWRVGRHGAAPAAAAPPSTGAAPEA